MGNLMNSESKIIDMANKKKKVFDQCASMHFKLSDEYKLLSNIEDAIEIAISVILCGVTFWTARSTFKSLRILQPDHWLRLDLSFGIHVD